MLLKRILTGVLTLSMVVGSAGVSAMAADENAKETKIFIVGDSTACNYGSDDNYAVPRAGWGMYLSENVTNAEVVNLAKSGRSSKSLTVEEEYQTLLNEIGEGDFLLIQFGHNDAKKSSEEDLQTRYTDPEGNKDTEGSFKNSLYTNYIKVAEEKGATPILLTPIARRSFDEEGNVKDTHGLYDDAVRELGAELNIPVADATKLTSDVYQVLDFEGTAAFHAIYKDVAKGDKGHDNTHLNHFGAEQVAFLVARELKDCGSDISKYIELSDGAVHGISRLEFTSAIVRIVGGEYADNAESCFPDVDVLSSDTTAISTAKKMGIVTGDTEGNFNPADEITIQDACVIAARALKAAGVELNTDSTDSEKYAIVSDSMPYAKESITAILNLSDSIFSSNYNPSSSIDNVAAYFMYSVIYDEINEADEDAVAQSIDEIEKVE